jgi:hypothetical protein
MIYCCQFTMKIRASGACEIVRNAAGKLTSSELQFILKFLQSGLLLI